MPRRFHFIGLPVSAVVGAVMVSGVKLAPQIIHRAAADRVIGQLKVARLPLTTRFLSRTPPQGSMKCLQLRYKPEDQRGISSDQSIRLQVS
ncbi:hypothetical protein PAXRUDRAFT_485791 [Paxillus rubicundulus Ve08.2h10]|uniref:Uncharacterized protein n=1 Tax=Paxillus rubicundulus Ve08.2h10 TaxID=930991 RepID=A0A0D0E174_9AGAM|nr:hypothetical protein PAXRUDRAFT_485791 [Paxillus rubicundulus Ve08.2h10]